MTRKKPPVKVKKLSPKAPVEPQTPPQPILTRSDKVAIVGFAPSSMQLAPFGDESWDIWTLNNIYACFDIPRWNRWFELHPNFREYAPMHDARIDPQAIVMGDARPVTKVLNHLDWLQAQPPVNPIFFVEPQPDIPAALPYPLEVIKAWCESRKFKPYFTNSISYMIAMALFEHCHFGDCYNTIGIYGVDMAANGEYQKERPSVEYWIGLAQGLGVEVVLPKESELLKARFYGFERDSDFVTKMNSRFQELMGNHNQACAQRDQANMSAWYFKGAADQCQYDINNWGNGG